MSAYVVVQGTIRDPEKFQLYAVESRDTIKAFGGRVIGRSDVEEIHGKATYDWGAIIEFPDRETALGWYRSDDYQSVTPIRDESSEMVFLLYEGFVHE